MSDAKLSEVKSTSPIQLNTIDHSYFFVVDLDTVLTGMDSYDEYEKREPGYALAYFKAFNYALENIKDISSGLTQDYIKNVHARVMSHKKEEKTAGTYKTIHTSIAISAHPTAKILSVSLEGFIEFIDRWLLKDPKPIASIIFEPRKGSGRNSYTLRSCNSSNPTFSQHRGKLQILEGNAVDGILVSTQWFNLQDPRDQMLIWNLLTHQDYTCDLYSMLSDTLDFSGYENVDVAVLTAERTQGIINAYEAAIKKTDSKAGKVEAIAKHMQIMDQLHPFPDGNIRTFSILSSVLLMKEKMFPSLQPNPNRFDVFSVKQLTVSIKAGQKYLYEFAQGKLPTFSSDDLTLGKGKRPILPIKSVKLDAETQAEANKFFSKIFFMMGIKKEVSVSLAAPKETFSAAPSDSKTTNSKLDSQDAFFSSTPSPVGTPSDLVKAEEGKKEKKHESPHAPLVDRSGPLHSKKPASLPPLPDPITYSEDGIWGYKSGDDGAMLDYVLQGSSPS